MVLHMAHLANGLCYDSIFLRLRPIPKLRPARSARAAPSPVRPSCAQPGPIPWCFSPDVACVALHHVTRSCHTRPCACKCSPVNTRPQRVHAHFLLMSPAHNTVYKSSLVPRDKLA